MCVSAEARAAAYHLLCEIICQSGRQWMWMCQTGLEGVEGERSQPLIPKESMGLSGGRSPIERGVALESQTYREWGVGRIEPLYYYSEEEMVKPMHWGRNRRTSVATNNSSSSKRKVLQLKKKENWKEKEQKWITGSPMQLSKQTNSQTD